MIVDSAKVGGAMDHLDPKILRCENCSSDDLTDPRPFNLMFKTNLGAVDDASSTAYLRPETAQGIFTNFKFITDTQSPKVPFGIAQIEKHSETKSHQDILYSEFVSSNKWK